MSPAAILIAARARIADPASWTTGAYARDASGKSVTPESPQAVCWCALGAIDAEDQLKFNLTSEQLRRAAVALYGEAVTTVNDGLGHTRVLAMYDHAIAIAKAVADAEGR